MKRIHRDGVSLAYQEAGQGNPPIVLVHGWACDHTHLAPQFEHLRASYRVVAVDLRGHGQSDKPQDGYSIKGFADDVAWLCVQLGVERPVVIGHSMGGVVAVALAASNPRLPGAIIALDSALVPHPGRPEQLNRIAEALQGDDYRQILEELLSPGFGPFIDSGLKAHILDQMTSLPQYVIAGSLAAIASHDRAAAAAACQAPLLYIHRGNPTTDLARLMDLCPQAIVAATVGAGHWLQLEVPDQVNAMIERFLAIGVSRPGTVL